VFSARYGPVRWKGREALLKHDESIDPLTLFP